MNILLCLLLICSCRDNPARENPPTAEKYSVISDTGATIDEVILQYSSKYGKEALPVHRTLIRELHHDTIIHVVFENTEQEASYKSLLGKWKTVNPRRIKTAILGKSMTVWARDRFVSTQSESNPGKLFFILPLLPQKPKNDNWQNEAGIPSLIAANSRARIASGDSSLFFEGGNLVTNDSTVFTAYSTIPFLTHEKILRKNEAEYLVAKEFGKKAVVLGDSESPVPAGHIDMYLTPVDETTVLLGDPELGEALYFSSLAGKSNSLGLETPPPAEQIAPVYDNAKRELEARGFAVERLPLMAFKVKNMIMTYNNVLMEKREGKKIVYLPLYGIPEMDGVAAQTYEKLGFEVKPVDVSGIFVHCGTVRCLANVISRRN